MFDKKQTILTLKMKQYFSEDLVEDYFITTTYDREYQDDHDQLKSVGINLKIVPGKNLGDLRNYAVIGDYEKKDRNRMKILVNWEMFGITEREKALDFYNIEGIEQAKIRAESLNISFEKFRIK